MIHFCLFAVAVFYTVFFSFVAKVRHQEEAMAHEDRHVKVAH
jgi:hypothetical protein